MLTYKLHLIRTGRTSANPWKRYVGQSDIPLCDMGREALASLRKEFVYPKVDAVYSSPMQRCHQTADILYPDRQRFDIPELMDMNLGEFEGKTFDELRGEEAFSRWLADSFRNTPPGGEKTEDFTKRVLTGLDRVFRHMTEQRTTSAAVVTHGGVIMALLAAAGLPKLPLHQWAVDNGCGYTLLMTTQMWMRDRAGEVFSFIPDQDGGADDPGLYYGGDSE